MKRCPECRRDYYDDTLLFCLDDGSALLEGPGGIHSTAAPSMGLEPATILIHSAAVTDDPVTLAMRAFRRDNASAIAVLPFANMSRDEDADYLSDGLAEELLNVLSRIQGLRVAGRTSAFSFKGKQTTFAEIGQQLNVSSVLEGSVRMSGRRVRIAVQLVNTSDGYQLWSETYDRTMDDIFAIQDDIASSVVEEVRSRLAVEKPDPDRNANLAAEVAVAAQGRAEDPEAHRLMLLGRHLADRRTTEDMAKAIQYFEEALKIDPLNAQCWQEIGYAQSIRTGHGFVDYEVGYTAARSAIEKALQLEPNLAGGHALLATLKLSWNRDFRGAEEPLRRALALEPDNAFVLSRASYVLGLLGKIDEPLDLARKLAALDPLNSLALQRLTGASYAAGKLDEAEMAARRSIELSPQGVYTHALHAVVLAEKELFDDARAEAAKEAAEIWKHWSAALVEIKAGRINHAHEFLDMIIQLDCEGFAFQIAEIYSAIGEIDNAFEFLDVAVKSDPGISHILISSPLRPLHEDPRWEPLLSRIGIPQEYWRQV
ncbi:MAG: hypothetical protein ABJA02_13060 [Acidobacteriota bacterium]